MSQIIPVYRSERRYFDSRFVEHTPLRAPNFVYSFKPIERRTEADRDGSKPWSETLESGTKPAFLIEAPDEYEQIEDSAGFTYLKNPAGKYYSAVFAFILAGEHRNGFRLRTET